jgi:hypothetical protein
MSELFIRAMDRPAATIAINLIDHSLHCLSSMDRIAVFDAEPGEGE